MGSSGSYSGATSTQPIKLYAVATKLADQSEKSFIRAQKNHHPNASKELNHAHKLLHTISKNQELSKQPYYSDIREARYNKMFGHQIVKHTELLTAQLTAKKKLLASYSIKKNKKKYTKLMHEVDVLSQKRLVLLEEAQLRYFAAIEAYIHAYDQSQKTRFLKHAEKLITHDVHAIEVAKYESSYIYVIDDTFAQLLQGVRKRKLTV